MPCSTSHIDHLGFIVRNYKLAASLQSVVPKTLQECNAQQSRYLPLSGHPSRQWRYATLLQYYYWPHMSNEVYMTVKSACYVTNKTCKAVTSDTWNNSQWADQLSLRLRTYRDNYPEPNQELNILSSLRTITRNQCNPYLLQYNNSIAYRIDFYWPLGNVL